MGRASAVCVCRVLDPVEGGSVREAENEVLAAHAVAKCKVASHASGSFRSWRRLKKSKSTVAPTSSVLVSL